MLGRSTMAAVREHAGAASELAARLARDKKFRKQLIGATKHGSRAKRHAARQIRWLSLASTPRDRSGASRRAAADDGRPAGGLGEAAGQAHEGAMALRNTLACWPAARRRPSRWPAQARHIDAEFQRRHDAACHRVVDRSRRAGIDRVQPMDAVRRVPAVHGWRRGSAPVGRHAPALGCVGRRPSRRVGREDPRAAPRPADQLDQRGRQEERAAPSRSSRSAKTGRSSGCRSATRRRGSSRPSAPRRVSIGGESKATSCASRS